MATPKVFLDTNLLIYTDDSSSQTKQAIAIQCLETHFLQRSAVVSIQVLQEYFSVTTRKLRVPSEIAREKVALFGSLEVFQPSATDILAAIDLHRLHNISFWDAMIVRAASQSGCRILLSEDLHPGQRLDGVEVVNPFLR